MPDFDFLFGTDTVPMGAQPTGYGDRQYESLDAARMSFLPESGFTTHAGHSGTPREVYRKLERAGASKGELKDFVKTHKR